jgi:hypothetical protein
MKPSGSVRMNQYTALCPQAFEYLTPGRLQSAATGSHAKMQPATQAAKTTRPIRTDGASNKVERREVALSLTEARLFESSTPSLARVPRSLEPSVRREGRSNDAEFRGYST